MLWKQNLEIFKKQAHVVRYWSARANLVKFVLISKQLNAGDTKANATKLKRNELIVTWLQELKDVPTLEQKLELKQKLHQLRGNKTKDDIID